MVELTARWISTPNRLLRALLSLGLVLALAACSPGEDAATRLERAGEFEARGDYRAAALELQRALQAEPDHGEARLRLGRLRVLAGNPEAAENELRHALRLGIDPALVLPWIVDAQLLRERYSAALTEIDALPAEQLASDPQWLVRRAEAYLGLDRVADAARDLEAAGGLDASLVRVLLGRARVAYLRGEYLDALSLARQATAAEPDDMDAQFVEGWFALRLGRFAEAETPLIRSVERARARDNGGAMVRARMLLVEAYLGQEKVAESSATVDALGEQLGDVPEMGYLRALVAYREGDYALARTWLRDVLLRNPDHTPAYLLAGGTAYALGEYDEAVRHLRRYLAVVPSNHSARRLLAAAELRRGRPEEALSTVETLRQADADEAEVTDLLALIGRSATASGQFETAERALTAALEGARGDARLRGELAQLRVAQGRYDEAIRELTRLAEAGEGDADLLLVRTLVAKGDMAEAARFAAERAGRYPDRPEWQSLTGLILLQRGERQQARDRFARALAVDADHVPAMLQLGRMALEEGDEPRARRFFQDALRVAPTHLGAMLGLAEAAERRGDSAQARQWLEKAVEAEPQSPAPRIWLSRFHWGAGQADAALQTAREAVRVSPKDADALRLLGDLRRETNDLPGALETYATLLTLYPRDVSARSAMAWTQARVGEPALARQTLSAGLADQPGELRLLAESARLELSLNDAARALEHAHAAQTAHPRSPVGWMLEGEVRERAGDHRAALESYRRAHGLSPSFATVQRIARVSDALGDPRQGIGVLNDWLAANPNHAPAMLALGMLYQRMGQGREAQTQYERLLAMHPDETVALNNLAWLYLDRQDPRALEVARRAYETGPGPATAHTYGWTLVQSGDPAAGLVLIEQAAAEVPLPEVRYRLAVALERTGERARARQVLSRLLEEHPSFRHRAEAEALYRSLQ